MARESAVAQAGKLSASGQVRRALGVMHALSTCSVSFLICAVRRYNSSRVLVIKPTRFERRLAMFRTFAFAAILSASVTFVFASALSVSITSAEAAPVAFAGTAS
jgi:hypothetical protein